MSPDDSKKKSKGHIVLSSHPASHTQAPLKIKWGEKTLKRGDLLLPLSPISKIEMQLELTQGLTLFTGPWQWQLVCWIPNTFLI